MLHNESEPKRIFGYESPERAEKFESAARKAWNNRTTGVDTSTLRTIREMTGISDPKPVYDVISEAGEVASRVDVPKNLINKMNS